MAGTPATAMLIETAMAARVMIVEARYHAGINDMLIEGTRAVLKRHRARVELVTMPGALEIPPAIALAHAAGGFDAFVALGCVIRGETTHYELVSGDSCRGIMDLGIRERAAIGNGILTVENMEQALERADPARQDKGGHAALAALSLVALRRRLERAA
ncbi:6,7-dimethyl-8-ribityllumazine synthase [Geminicoccaceae bacterium 1502E]|nr:6,7-dimethyl-8-ribityllumazine synthase [Geminicoccaceae bacterium 1502E]